MLDLKAAAVFFSSFLKQIIYLLKQITDWLFQISYLLSQINNVL